MENLSIFWRELVVAVGGPLNPPDNRKSWLHKVAARAGLSPRVVRAAYYAEQMSRRTEQRLREAANAHEFENYAVQFEVLAEQLRQKDEGFYGTQIDQLRGAAREIRKRHSAGEG